jgi:hypothetical protein
MTFGTFGPGKHIVTVETTGPAGTVSWTVTPVAEPKKDRQGPVELSRRAVPRKGERQR